MMMPVVIMRCDSTWLPPDGKPNSDMQRTTAALVKELRGMIAKVMNEVDGTEKYTAAKVALDFQSIHSWSEKDLPNWWISLEPGDVDGTEFARRYRRYTIALKLHERIASFLDGYVPTFRPSYDVDCRPISGSGVSVDKTGNIVDQWGNDGFGADE